MDRHKDGFASPVTLPPGAIQILTRASFMGIFWKCARIGERLSPYVSLFCVFMAVRLLV
jgi:hypothetical protein